MNESKYAASASDGKEILRILESSAAKGNIELIYTRRPDAYESYRKESGEARVFISRSRLLFSNILRASVFSATTEQ